MTGECDPLTVPSRKCCCPLRQRGTGRACAAFLKTCWRTSLTGNCLPSSWGLELGSMLYVLPRRCLLSPGSLQMSHRSAWTGQWQTEPEPHADTLTVIQLLWSWLNGCAEVKRPWLLHVCLQHQGIHHCHPCEDCAAASAAGCRSAVAAMGRCF